MTTIIDKITAAHFVATEAQVEALAAQHWKDGDSLRATDGTYLKVLIAACQAKLGRPGRGRRPAAESQLTVLDAVNGLLYAAVLRGVADSSIAVDPADSPAAARGKALERNRRSAFARTTASTVRAFVLGGGDLRGITLADVTKGALRAAVMPAEPPDKGGRQVSRAQSALIRAAIRLAKREPARARDLLEHAIEAMQFALDGIPTEDQPDMGATTTVAGVRHQRTRVGTPMLNRPAP